MDYSLWGLDPRGYHLTNTVLHALNTLLVFFIARRLVEKAGGQNPQVAATVAALLFGIHPLHVESVAWVSERKDVLYSLFYLLGILTYLKYVAFETRRRGLYYCATLFFFVLSLMSKPMAVTFPLVLLILDWYPLARFSPPPPPLPSGFKGVKGCLIEKASFIILAVVAGLVALWAQSASGAARPLDAFPFIERIGVALRALVFYLSKMVVPVDLAPALPDANYSLGKLYIELGDRENAVLYFEEARALGVE